jgi:hypothetical protein
MGRINRLTARLRNAPHPPVSHAGGTADVERAKCPLLDQTSAPDSE